MPENDAKPAHLEPLENLNVGHIRCRSITLENESASVVVSAGWSDEAEGSGSGAGIWLTDKRTGARVCICAGFGQGAQVSLRSRHGSNVGHDIALHADSDGAAVQLVVPGPDGQPYRTVTVPELIQLLDAAKGGE